MRASPLPPETRGHMLAADPSARLWTRETGATPLPLGARGPFPNRWAEARAGRVARRGPMWRRGAGASPAPPPARQQQGPRGQGGAGLSRSKRQGSQAGSWRRPSRGEQGPLEPGRLQLLLTPADQASCGLARPDLREPDYEASGPWGLPCPDHHSPAHSRKRRIPPRFTDGIDAAVASPHPGWARPAAPTRPPSSAPGLCRAAQETLGRAQSSLP